MDRNQRPDRLRRRVAFLLLVTNLVAFPLSFANRGAIVKAAPPDPFDEPTDFIRQIPLATNDLVYSSLTGKI